MKGIFCLQKPLENTESFTLEDILASPEIIMSDAEYKRNSRKAERQVSIDNETIAILKLRFGNIPLGRAIRSLVGLPPIEKQDEWQEWKDNVIRECYSWGGSIAVLAQDVKRSANAIRRRAGVLKIKAGNFKPNAKWLSLHDIAAIFHCHYTLVFRWCKKGLLKPIIKLEGRKREAFFTETELIRFIRDYPFVYPHERLTNGYKQYLPSMLSEWINTKQASIILCYSIAGINNRGLYT